jgi:hypothetical protein
MKHRTMMKLTAAAIPRIQQNHFHESAATILVDAIPIAAPKIP